MSNTQLITIATASARYPIPKRTLRKLIATGRLAASKVGRELIVADEDVARLLAPTLRRQPVQRAERESPNAQAVRQLRNAGVDL